MNLIGIIMAICAIAIIAGFALAFFFDAEFGGCIIGMAICTLLVLVPFAFAMKKTAASALNAFTQQKAYIENYVPISEYDSAAILSKKIELNEWLYDAQYTKNNHPLMSFYGDEILALEPIQ